MNTKTRNIVKKCSLVIILLLASWSLIAQTNSEEYHFATESGLNSIINDGFEISGFDFVRSRGRNVLQTNNEVTSKTPHSITTPFIYFNPANNLEFLAIGNLNNGNIDDFELKLEIINRKGEIVASYSFDGRNNAKKDTEYKFNFPVEDRGFYKLRFSHAMNEKSKGKGKQPTMDVSKLEINGIPNTSKFTTTPWVAKSGSNLNINTGDRTYLVGDEVGLDYLATLETSDNDLFIERAIFRVEYPEGINIKKIDLYLNNNIYATTTGGSWVPQFNGASKSKLNMGLNPRFNDLEVENIDHNDKIRIVVTADAKTPGVYPTSISFIKGWAKDKSIIQSNSFGGNIISFSTQEDEPNVEDGGGSNSNLEIIPFGTQPIELIYFNVKNQKEINAIEWATAIELDNDFFTIERSTDGINFSSIAEIEGKGTYSGTSKYSYTDLRPVSGTSYYRLTQTDFDGTSKTFEAVRSVREDAVETTVSVLQNPSSRNRILYSIDAERNNEYSVSLIDTNGQVIAYTNVVVENSDTYSIEGLSLTKGVYLLNINNNQERIVKKVLVN